MPRDVGRAGHSHQNGARAAHTEEVDGEALLTLVASGDNISFFAESTAPLVRVGAVLKRVRDLDVVVLGRSVWRVADESDPLVRSLLEITNSVHAS